MTSTTATSFRTTGQDRPWLISPSGWVWIAVIGFLFLWLHETFLYRTYLFATTDNNWSHALIVPLISLYYIFQKREQLRQRTARVCWWGLPILFVGLLSYAWWIWPGRNDMFRGYSMILSLLGLVLFLLGPKMMGVLWFPIVYLGFGVKIAEKIWSQIAWHLQQIAAEGATLAMKFIAVFMSSLVNVAHRGSTIDITYRGAGGALVTDPLNVAEACSGLRMLMAFIALGVALAFLWERPWWQRLVMVLLAVPIAIAVNIGRVTAIGVLFTHNKDMAAGDFHIFVGMLMLVPAAGLFLLLGWIMDKIVIREEGEDEHPAAPSSSQAASAGVENTVAVEGEADEQDGPGPAEPGDASLWRPAPVSLGAGAGVVLTLLVTGVYILGIQVFAGDALVAGGGGVVAKGLLGLTVAALVAAVLALPWLVRWIARNKGPAALVKRVATLGLAAGVLLTATVSQAGIINFMKIKLIKKPVPLRHQLLRLPTQVGDWEFIRDDPRLSAEVQDTLGTDTYISRWYRDTSRPENTPGSIARVHIAYYTGNPDTVPHVPDRCFVAGGLEPIDSGEVTLHLTSDQYRPDPAHGGFLYPAKLDPQARVPAKNFNARIFTFADPDNPERAQNVIYFFAANGQFLPSPEMVRFQGFDPRDKYSYYCKVEVQLPGVGDPEQAKRRVNSLLSPLLPEIMACLPDWVQVKAGTYPAENETDAP